MWLKKKDRVVILRGKEKGKRGEILKMAGDEKFVVTKMNMVKRHQKTRGQEVGGIIEKEAPIHQSKLMLVCPRCDAPTRAVAHFLNDGQRVRKCRECSEVIE